MATAAAPTIPPRRMLAALILPLAASPSSGCAGGGPPLQELTPWGPPVGQSCTVIPARGGLAARLDTGAVGEAVRQRRPANGTLLVSAALDSTGLHGFRTIETDLPEGDAAALEVAIRDALRPGDPAPARDRGRIVLRTSAGTVRELRVGRSSTAVPPSSVATKPGSSSSAAWPGS